MRRSAGLQGMHESQGTAELKPATPRAVGFVEALAFWLKLGFISFGGPAGQISLMHQELVQRRQWISEQRFMHALNYCMLLPGPEAQQLATYIGWLMHKTRGGIAAGTLFVLPSLFILIALSWVYVTFGQLALVSGLFYGVKPAVIAIVLQAVHRIGTRALKNRLMWVIAGAAFFGIFALHVPFPLIIGVAALAGMAGGKWAPQFFAAGVAHGVAVSGDGASLIDDHTSTPSHAQFSWQRLLTVISIGALLWILPLLLLVSQLGGLNTLTQMAWFFTKAAWLTFGGAYAVLPYVYQGAVTNFGWLTPGQMMDGLALGETTPGPLIMVVAFVAFLGGSSSPDVVSLFASHGILLGGALAACIVTWFTFLPSFVMIFAGGPVIESTRQHLKLTAPLTAITAAVVGVVLSLAIFFAFHVLWPQGFAGTFDWFAASLAVACALALIWFQWGFPTVVAVSASIGLLVTSRTAI